MTTGIPILDAILQLAGAFFITWLMIANMARMVKMYKDHAYGQLAASIIFFIVTYAFVAMPQKTSAIVSKLLETVFTKV